MVGRIVVHFGFHKTGTSSLQATIRAHKQDLWPYMALGLRAKMRSLTQAATGWSVIPTPFGLEEFRHRSDAFLQGFGLEGKRGLLISEEDLAGLMPGRSDVKDYSAICTLLPVFRDALRTRWGSDDIVFVATTRAKAPWLRSIYGHTLQASRLRMGFADFEAEFAQAADHGAVLDHLRDALGDSPLLVHDIADVDRRLGVAEELFELMGVPKQVIETMTPVRRRNVGGTAEVLQDLLALNRSGLSNTEVADAKDRVMSAHRRSVRQNLVQNRG